MDETKRIQDFLDVCQGKSKQETCDLMKTYSSDVQLVQEIINIIELNHASQLCDSICEVLFNLNSSGEDENTKFCLQFLPALIWAYYSLKSKNVKWGSSKVETLLLFVYNQVVRVNNEIPFCNSFSIPSLSKASIYHEPTMAVVPEHTLTQQDISDKPVLLKGPTKFLDRIPAGFRSLVIKSTLNQYNAFLSFYLVPSLNSFCRMVVRLSCCGFPYISHDNDFISVEQLTALQNYPKVSLSGDVVKEMVTALHFCAFNGSTDVAVNALEYLNRKSCYSICTAAVLITKAMQDLISLSSDPDKYQFHHCPPVNPYKCNYRGIANLSSMHKRRLTKISLSGQRTPQRVDASSLKPSLTSSPRLSGTSNISSCDTGEASEKGYSPVFTELDKTSDSTDGDVLNDTAGLDMNGHVNFSMGSVDLDDNVAIINGHLAETSFSKIANKHMATPKIIIDLSDFPDEKNSDDVPLINNVAKKDSNCSDVSFSGSMNTSYTPLHSEVRNDTKPNGNINTIYDTQL